MDFIKIEVSKYSMLIQVDDKTFKKEVLEKSEKIPVVVDFFASWCGPCQMLGPVIEKLSEKLGSKVLFVKADVEKCETVTSLYGITTVPTVKLFKNKKVVDFFIGFKSEEEIIKWIDKNL